MSSESKRMKRTKTHQVQETSEEPPPKKVRKVKAAVSLPPKPEPALLGSLPLYGEELPDGGFDNIPGAAKKACAGLRDVLGKIRELKEDASSSAKGDVNSEKQKGLILFSSLRRLNRLSHLCCKDTREQTHEQKLEVDDLHLQLQNLKYEAMHLRREITNCLEFKSQHEDIELITEQEFYAQAPETISRPETTKSDEHQRMLCRLEWELEQRKQLSQQQESLEKQIATEEAAIREKEEKLNGLHPALDSLQKATLPLQEMLGLPLDKLREEESLAQLLPEPLYILYVQARGYAEVEDPSLSVCVSGDADEAKAFRSGSAQLDVSDEESGESDTEGGKDNSRSRKKSKKRKRSSEPVDVSKAHPLCVHLTFAMRNCGTFKLTLSYLPHFSAVCVSVATATISSLPDSQSSAHLDKSSLLPCLFEGDSGRVSPNSVVSFNIRKHGGDVFSAAVRQYGFPYKWVQSLCGISVLGEGGEGGSVQPMAETSVENMDSVMAALKKRFKAQVNLARQIVRLEEGKTWMGEEEPSPSPQSLLVRWKSVTSSEVQSLQFGSECILNLQDRTNRFYLATLQHGQDPSCVRMHSLVCLSTDYPATPPAFALRIHSSSGKKEPHDIHIKNIEAQVNIHFPRSLPEDPSGRSLMTQQVHHLRECLDHYVGSKGASSKASKALYSTRGKGRLLSFS